VAALFACGGLRAMAAEPLVLNDGERIVLIGSTLIERDQASGYLETLLTLRHPNRNLTFRNLGWSGDTVWGESRAGFGTPADGFRSLREHVIALKPTVLIVGYGTVESFEGEAGLTRFINGLEGLLDALAETKARVMLLSPLLQERLGPPLPDPGRHNEDVRRYASAIRGVADRRRHRYIDLIAIQQDLGSPEPLTDNGIHPTEAGYARLDRRIAEELGLGPPRWRVEIGERKSSAGGAMLAPVEASKTSARFVATDQTLPAPLGADEDRILTVPGLEPGSYSLRVDGHPVATATADGWALGVSLSKLGPELAQAEKLRAAINTKNRLYFYRWRPQNETYLFGFRKHEQGQNAREIPLFDPLVAAAEAEIAKLRVPRPHTYELVRTNEDGK
jgi:lysophospholipase L1-like esterase